MAILGLNVQSYIGRAALVSAAAGFAIWLILIVTLPKALASRDPASALSWAAFDANAQAETAALVAERGSNAQSAIRAKALATSALQRSPVSVMAARTLAMLAAKDGDAASADRLLRYAESISRRDAPTQLLLTKIAADRNDVDDALKHIDRALRSSRASRTVLIPALISGSADPIFLNKLAALIATRPPWWRLLAHHLVHGGGTSNALGTLIGRLRLDLSDDGERGILGAALDRLVREGDYIPAYRMYHMQTGAPSSSFIRHGDFQSEDLLPPFEWHLVDEPDFGALRKPRAGDRNEFSLYLFARNGRGGLVARQLLVLPPRKYEISAVVGDVADDVTSRPTMSLTCVDSNSETLMTTPLPKASLSSATLRRDFVVPLAGCPAQWLSIAVSSEAETGSDLPWIDAIAVSPL